MSDATIKTAIQQLAGTHLADEVFVALCTVDSVNQAARTCDCTPLTGKNTGQIPDVRLMSEVEDGLLLLPVVGSTVTIAYSKYTDPFVAQYGAVDKAIISTTSGFQFNDGSLGGLVTVQELTTKLNNLENLVNDLVAKYNVHIHPATSGTTSPTVSQETGTLTLTQRADIENTAILQGV